MRKAVPATICFLLLFVPLATAGTGGLRLENDRFIIHYTAGDDGLAAELIRDSLRIRERVIADIGVDFAEKTEIRLSPTIEAFREAQPGGKWIPLWAAGVAYPEQNVIVLLSPRAIKGSRMNVIEVFAHEFSHVALGRALTGVRGPGPAERGARHLRGAGVDLFPNLRPDEGLPHGPVDPPAGTLSFPAEEEPAELAYAESFMFISFLITRWAGRPSTG